MRPSVHGRIIFIVGTSLGVRLTHKKTLWEGTSVEKNLDHSSPSTIIACIQSRAQMISSVSFGSVHEDWDIDA